VVIGAKRPCIAKLVLAYVSIFGCRAKKVEAMTKQRRMVLCIVDQNGASVVIIVCLTRRARSVVLSSYGRSKFATRCIYFWATCVIGRHYAETAPYVAVRWTAGRGERGSRGVLYLKGTNCHFIKLRAFEVCNTTCRFLGDR